MRTSFYLYIIAFCALIMSVGISIVNSTSPTEFSQKVDQLLNDVSRSNLTPQELEALSGRLTALKQESNSATFSTGKPEESSLEKGIPGKFSAIDRKMAAANK